MEKAEKLISFKQKAPEIIRNKVRAYDNPYDEMVIYASQKSKYFSKESDVVLLCLTDQVGYGKWKEIKRAVRREPRCRFDHLFLSRNEQELQRRVDVLIKALEKEEQINRRKLISGDHHNEEDMNDLYMEDVENSEESKLHAKSNGSRKASKKLKGSNLDTLSEVSDNEIT